MLRRKLRQIEEGMAYSGKRTKIARSQGRKVQVTIDQERSRFDDISSITYFQFLTPVSVSGTVKHI